MILRLALGAAALPVSAAARAQVDDVGPFHWAYAAMYGSGTYALADGTEALVVRGAFSKLLREAPTDDGGGPSVRLLLPVMVGIQNLDDDELPPERPADRAEAVAFLPGIELEHTPGEHWTVRTRAQLGWGKELQGVETRAVLAAVGARSKLQWSDAPGRPALINGLLWAGFDPDSPMSAEPAPAGAGERRSLLRFTTALEFDVRVPRWEFRDQPMRLLPHVLKDWFYRPPPALAFGAEDFAEVEGEWQIGLAAGREQGFTLLGFEFDSVGIAYRFSDHSEGIRFYLNSVF